MTRWEYVVVSFDLYQVKAAQETLNQRGAEGWEVVGFVYVNGELIYTLKRPTA